MKLTKQHKATHDHQAFDMMAVACLQQFLYHIVDRENPRCTLPKTVRNLSFKAPEIFAPLLAALPFIDNPDKLAPAQNLPDEAF